MKWSDPYVSESGVESRGVGFTVYRGVAIVFDLWWKRVSWRPFWWRSVVPLVGVPEKESSK